MSHFVMIVLGDNHKAQLAPFDEDITVEAYERECYCLSARASQYRNQGLKDLGLDIDDLRESFEKIPALERPTWQEHVKSYVEAGEKLTAEFEGGANPDCEECKGSGKDETTYNPKSKWDWYQVGGRWTGFFKAKPNASFQVGDGPMFSQSNTAASGHADVIQLKNIDFKAMDEEAEALADKRWSEYTSDIDAEPDAKKHGEIGVKHFGVFGDPPRTFEECQASYARPYVARAILKDGEWFEKGRMGMFGMSFDDKSDKDWFAEWDRILAETDPETWVTVVDCHI